jgi:hypothetical protein
LKASSLAQKSSGEASVASRSSDVLHLSISDDANPLNLYLASIDLPTFLKMRTEQNIFVEFSQLPEKL